jgi:hypothetical protein
MRSRIVDLALLVGLVAVSGGILWTLFTLGAEPRQANPTPAPPAVTAPPAATDEPGGASAGARGVVAIAPDAASPDAADADADAQVAADAADAADVADGDATDADTATDVDAPPPVPVPPVVRADGTIELERIGFSYVTGGAGACGVVLEAWVHVAVSRDLLAAYGCGAEVTVVLDDPAGERSEVVGVIGDTMNPSFARTVNVYVGEDEDAFAYGLTTGSFAPR